MSKNRYTDKYPDVKVQEITTKVVISRQQTENLVNLITNSLDTAPISFEHIGRSDVQIHGSYKTVSDILFEAAKKDMHMLTLLESAYKRADQWRKEHPIEPEYVEEDEDDEDAICFGA